MYFAGCLTGEGALKRRFKIGGTIVAGGLVMRDAAVAAEIVQTSQISGTDAYGIALEAATYAATAESTVDVVYNPFLLVGGVVTGTSGTSNNVALTVSTLTSASASGVSIVTSNLPSNGSMVNGLVYALTGNNKGQSRILRSSISGTSGTVVVEFDNAFAVGDTVLVLAAGPGAQTVKTSADTTQVAQWYESASGIAANVVDVFIDATDASAPTAKVMFVLRDHQHNPLS